MRCYLIFLDKNKVKNSTIIYSVYKKIEVIFDNTEYILYGYTDKKRYKNEFMNQRNEKYFKVVKHDIDKLEFDKVRDDINPFRIDYINFKGRNSSVNILSTAFEHTLCHSLWMDVIMDESVIIEISNEIQMDFYSSLKTRYLKALELICAIQMCSSFCVSPEEYLEYNDDWSSVVVSSGNDCIPYTLRPDEASLFAHVYSELMSIKEEID